MWGARLGAPVSLLAAAAVVVAATVVGAAAVVGKAHAVAAAVAEQEDQDDDPANVTTTETIVIAHNEYLRDFFERLNRSFQDILQPGKGAARRYRIKKTGAWISRAGVCYAQRPLVG